MIKVSVKLKNKRRTQQTAAPPTKLFAQRGVTLLAIRLFGVGMMFVVNIMLTRGLGVDGYGTYAFLLAIVTLAALFAQFGMPDVVVRETSNAIAAKTPGVISGLWSWAHAFIIFASLLGIAIIWLWLNLTQENSARASNSVYIALILIPLISLSNLRSAMLRGLGHDVLGQLPENAIRPTLFALALLIIFLLPRAPMSVVDAFVAQLFAVAMATAFGFVTLWKLAPREARITADRSQKRSWYVATFNIGIISGLVLINNSVDIIMLGLWKTDADVGIYRLASTVGALVALGLQTMNMYAMPHLTRSLASGEKAELTRIVRHSTQISLGFGAVSFAGILLLGAPTLTLVFGGDFRDAFPVLLVLALGHITNAFFGPAHTLLIMAGQERLTAQLTGIGAVANVAMNALLIPSHGPIGAAIASAVTLVITKLMAFFFVWRLHGILSWPFPPNK
jgi:O-antigen/teichoic acid export membrane protein